MFLDYQNTPILLIDLWMFKAWKCSRLLKIEEKVLSFLWKLSVIVSRPLLPPWQCLPSILSDGKTTTAVPPDSAYHPSSVTTSGPQVSSSQLSVPTFRPKWRQVDHRCIRGSCQCLFHPQWRQVDHRCLPGSFQCLPSILSDDKWTAAVSLTAVSSQLVGTHLLIAKPSILNRKML